MQTNQRTNPSYGTKVSDPNATLQESAGPVPNESLAAESVRSGGTFADNRNAEPSAANTQRNTSGATKLPPDSDSKERDLKRGANEGRYPEDAGGQSREHAVEYTPTSNYTTHSERMKGHTSSDGSAPRSQGGAAPSYIEAQLAQDPHGPHGKNLTEGGFSSNDSKNASWNTDIGSKNDPGRLAEQKFQRENEQSAQDAGFPRDKTADTRNEYSRLESSVDA